MSKITRYYRFADITFQIMGDANQLYREDGVLESFRAEGPEWDHSVCYDVVDILPVPEGSCIFQGSRIQVFRQGDAQVSCLGDAALLPEGAHTHIIRRNDRTLVRIPWRRSITLSAEVDLCSIALSFRRVIKRFCLPRPPEPGNPRKRRCGRSTGARKSSMVTGRR